MNRTDYVVKHQAPSQEDEIITLEGLRQHTRQVGGVDYSSEPFSLLIHSKQGLIHSKQGLVASLIGKVIWNWLYVDLLWVSEDSRGAGLGSRLMHDAERAARDRHLTGIYLWTQSWQALAFYEKLGYERFAVFDDFPPGHQRYGLRKYLY